MHLSIKKLRIALRRQRYRFSDWLLFHQARRALEKGNPDSLQLWLPSVYHLPRLASIENLVPGVYEYFFTNYGHHAAWRTQLLLNPSVDLAVKEKLAQLLTRSEILLFFESKLDPKTLYHYVTLAPWCHVTPALLEALTPHASPLDLLSRSNMTWDERAFTTALDGALSVDPVATWRTVLSRHPQQVRPSWPRVRALAPSSYTTLLAATLASDPMHRTWAMGELKNRPDAEPALES